MSTNFIKNFLLYFLVNLSLIVCSKRTNFFTVLGRYKFDSSSLGRTTERRKRHDDRTFGLSLRGSKTLEKKCQVPHHKRSVCRLPSRSSPLRRPGTLSVSDGGLGGGHTTPCQGSRAGHAELTNVLGSESGAGSVGTSLHGHRDPETEGGLGEPSFLGVVEGGCRTPPDTMGPSHP